MFVHLRNVDDGVGGLDLRDLHNGLGDGLLLRWHEVMYILPHGEQVRGHCILQSRLGLLPSFPLRLSSIENIIRGNMIYYLEDWLKEDFILQLLDVSISFGTTPLRQIVFSKSVGIWWNIRRWRWGSTWGWGPWRVARGWRCWWVPRWWLCWRVPRG